MKRTVCDSVSMAEPIMRNISIRRKIIYMMVILAIAVGLIECALHVGYVVVRGEPFPARQYDREKSDILSEKKARQGRNKGLGEYHPLVGVEVIHPFLGYVWDPDRTDNVSNLGFRSLSNDIDPFAPVEEDVYTIVVIGGSFAAGTAKHGEAIFKSILASHGMNVRVLNYALGGYKQPQQINTLTFLLSHGADIDVVINIDGYNEAALSLVENLPKGVNPFYPRDWYTRTAQLEDVEGLRRIGRLTLLQDRRRSWTRMCRRLPKFSVIAHSVWRTYDNHLVRKMSAVRTEIKTTESGASSRFLTTGPRMEIDESNYFDFAADHWVRCSRLIKTLCDGNDITYIHVLQPNQYLPQSKVLTEEERRYAYAEDSPQGRAVAAGYPTFIERGKDLHSAGVNYHDLTMIYRDVHERVYKDVCCHPYPFGYEIVATFLANEIVKVHN